MNVQHYPPQWLLDLFVTPELAESRGRQETLLWMQSLDLHPGDEVFVPEKGWHVFAGRSQ